MTTLSPSLNRVQNAAPQFSAQQAAQPLAKTVSNADSVLFAGKETSSKKRLSGLGVLLASVMALGAACGPATDSQSGTQDTTAVTTTVDDTTTTEQPVTTTEPENVEIEAEETTGPTVVEEEPEVEDTTVVEDTEDQEIAAGEDIAVGGEVELNPVTGEPLVLPSAQIAVGHFDSNGQLVQNETLNNINNLIRYELLQNAIGDRADFFKENNIPVNVLVITSTDELPVTAEEWPGTSAGYDENGALIVVPETVIASLDGLQQELTGAVDFLVANSPANANEVAAG